MNDLCYEGNPLAIDVEFFVYFEANLNELLNKQSNCRSFERPWRPSNGIVMDYHYTNIITQLRRHFYDIEQNFAQTYAFPNID